MSEAHVRRIKIMISSTRADLAQYREEAAQIIERVAKEKEKKVQLVEVSMEKETQTGNREFAVAVSKRWVEESDWLIVIVGWNYGTISDEPGADYLSVTEWEYRHAYELDKKIFVFMAGEPGSTYQYRYSEGEDVDLKDWIPKQKEKQKRNLEKFRKQLGEAHADMFANLQMFRERLEKTLKDAVDKLHPEIEPGSPLAELIVAVTPAIRDCIRKVTLIANCKWIHDHLHDLRQYVIRRLREEVLPGWQEQGELDASRERKICGCVNKASGMLGAIREVRKVIGPEHGELRYFVDKLLEWPELWNIESDSPDSRPSMETFDEAVRKFSSAVQYAFSEADSVMRREESSLDILYVALLKGLKEAEHNRNLSANDDQKLNDELGNVDAHRSRVSASLETHHSWQQAHDHLYLLDSLRGTDIFDEQLRNYRDMNLGKLVHLVDDELKKTDVGQEDNTQTVEGTRAAVVRHGAPPPSWDSHICDTFVDNLRRLKEGLKALNRGSGIQVFDKMREGFDDAFYCVDKRTLGEVNAARTRVNAFEELLDKLAKGRRKGD